MACTAPARRRGFVLAALRAGAYAAWLWPLSSALADPRDTYLVVGGTAEQRAAFADHARRWLAEHDVAATPADEPQPAGTEAALSHTALEALTSVEVALEQARTLSARFDERGALRVLSAAETRLLSELELDGAHAYLAELHVRLALTALSLGERGLGETALRRASTIDPERRVQAGEAPPPALALARAIERERDASTRSRARVEAEPAGALVWLDGKLLGDTPRELETSPGTHVLVVRRAGHAPYAALIELGPGARPPIRVALSPLPEQQARLALVEAREDVWSARKHALTLAAQGGASVFLFALSPEGGEVLRCRGQRCENEGRLPLRSKKADTRRPEELGPSWWKRWPVWTAASIAILAGAGAALWLGRDTQTRTERELTIDPGTLPAAGK